MPLVKCCAAGLSLALAIGASSAKAEDDPELPQISYPAPPLMPYEAPAPGEVLFNWSGFYAGLSAGGGIYNGGTIVPSSNVEAVVAAYNSFYSFYSVNPYSTQSVVKVPTPNNNSAGVSAGGLTGFNYQVGSIVFGVETDFSYSGLKSERSGNASTTCCSGATEYFAFDTVNKINWYGTVRDRLGFTPVQRVLVYGTGGLAYGQVETSVSNSNTFSTTTISPELWQGSRSQIKIGWTAGAGAEYALTDHIVLGAEYLYVDLGSSSATATYQGPQVNAEASQIYYTGTRVNRFSVARAALSYKF